MTPTCPQCALSMFLSAEAAKSFFQQKKRKHPQIGALLGDHLAEVALRPEHGVQTKPNEEGHFALHEYENVDLAEIASLKGPLA